jgi:hypothetical protein
MQFKVPQFLDIEDKIFGPFTFKEFVYLAGGAGLCFTLFKLLGFVLGAVPILLVGGFSLALTFYRPNNKPFVSMLESGFKYLSQSKLYIWKKRPIKTGKVASTTAQDQATVTQSYASKLSSSRLRDLAWSLDVLDLGKQQEQSQR